MAHGGRRNGAGRPKGAPNKSSAWLRGVAQEYSEVAVKSLVEIATQADNASARVAAIKELLDRGFGKATASHELTGRDGAPLAAPTIVIETGENGSNAP